MKRKMLTGALVLAAASLLLLSCSELKKDLPAPTVSTGVVHPTGWADATSPNFHGTALLSGKATNKDCAKCHSAAYSGGTSGVSCFKCHALYPHMVGWSDSSSADFHGDYLKGKSWDYTECQSCHGADFSGGSSGKSCYTCHASYPHKSGWGDPASASSHGKYVKAQTPAWDVSSCAPCHGATYTGGSSNVACFTCHPPFPHEVAFNPGYHTAYMKNNGFPYNQCQDCHGASYAGGPVVDVSCMTSGCHVDNTNAAKSPEACNTCHGTFRAQATFVNGWAPPRSIAGDTLESVVGVGAHQPHLEGEIGKPVKCQECHTVPATLNGAGHIDPAPYRATVAFNDTLARLATGNGTLVPTPSYNTSAVSCASVYCHGNWKIRQATSIYGFMYIDSVMTGNKATPVWNGGEAQAACGSCHGLPPAGHAAAPLTLCYYCHTGVVDNTGTIIDPTKHINGKVNVYGNEYSY